MTSRSVDDVAGYGTATHRATPGEPTLATIAIPADFDRTLTFTVTPIAPETLPSNPPPPQEPEA